MTRLHMPFFLKHYFDPDFDFQHLHPTEKADGSVDHYQLNYVQNVVEGQLIAEWVEVSDEEAKTLDARFLSEGKLFPAGRGCGIKRSSPDMLYAARDGFVLYLDGKITVRSALNVRRDVDYNTGNISFVSKLNIFGSVRAGFQVEAKEVDIDGQIEGAKIKTLGDISCRGGVKGQGNALLEAGGDIKLEFCEYALIKARKNILIRGGLMHSRAYCGGRMAVGGRMQGSEVFCHKYVYVGEQLGGGLDSDMSIVLGYHPMLMHADRELADQLRLMWRELQYYEKQDGPGGMFDRSMKERRDHLEASIKEIQARRARLWRTIKRTENLKECKVLVPGVVKPGVEISIGPAYLKVEDRLEDVYFYYDDGEIVIGNNKIK